MKLEFAFERGGIISANLLPSASKTGECVGAALPIQARVYQARWSGKEIYVPVNLSRKPAREHQSIRAGLGDVIYFCEWEGQYEHTGFEAIGLFYGAEIVREWRGDAPVNVFGRIDPAQWDLIQTIGDRIWRQGGEDIAIRIVSD